LGEKGSAAAEESMVVEPVQVLDRLNLAVVTVGVH
jgi:hypothetical protein